MSTVGLLHPGEMGAALGAQLREAGHEVLWVSSGRSHASAQRAETAGLTDVGDLTSLMDRAELILSVCPPHAAHAVAASLTGFRGPYVDANAIAPATVHSLSELQPQLIDGGIVGPPPQAPGSTRLYLSGPGAPFIAQLFAATTVDARAFAQEIGAASALKMAYAAWTKGTAALLLGTRALARAEGIEAALLAEWEISQPQLTSRSASAAHSAVTKGWRWEGEMEEIAASFGAAGLPEGFHRAAAEIYARSPRATADGEVSLEQLLAALREPQER